MAARRAYVIDSHLYIDALRSEKGRDALTVFQDAFAPFLHLSDAGAVLVTGNTADFARIATARRFDFVPPWP